MLILVLFHDSGYHCLKHFYLEKVSGICGTSSQRLFLITVLLKWKKRWMSRWSFGFKVHLICNKRGKPLNFMITPGNVDDRKPLKYKFFVEFVYGKLVDNKGYIGKHLFSQHNHHIGNIYFIPSQLFLVVSLTTSSLVTL